MWISEHGPHGPVSPICQKLSLSPSRWMRSSGHTDLLVPDRLRLVVAVVDGDPQAVTVEAPSAIGDVAGDQIPAPGNDRFFEIVAEAEVAHHLEEHQMTLGTADIVEVVVLAAGTGALLRADGAGVRRDLVADEVRLERHHAGDREHDRRVMGDQARRGHHGVVLRCEKIEEGLSKAVCCAAARDPIAHRRDSLPMHAASSVRRYAALAAPRRTSRRIDRYPATP